ncbi:HAD hydrolase family protein [Verrucomicrobium sp. GAS474]|uniref:HAD family hydrolase n=1 Tax=Verrucomicrobium sp. GAS474 TaxID=1882831 RepID=UPI0012FF7E79|nr:HAD hydrolase family protein [Verrucomicrobium sp. GAS474]
MTDTPASFLQPVRLVSTDLDGTLIDFRPNIPADAVFFDRIETARSRARGGEPFLWTMNTGRWWQSLSVEMMVRNFPLMPDWVILTEREIYRIHNGRALGEYGWNRRCAEVHRELFASAEPFWKELRDFIESQTGAELLPDPGSPVALRSRTDHEADRISQFAETRLAAWPGLSIVRNGVYMRFCHSDYDKGSCLRYLQEIVGVPPSATLAAGDHYNDLPMLTRRSAHWLVCPGNAIEPVRSVVLAQGGYTAGLPFASGVVEGWDALLVQAGAEPLAPVPASVPVAEEEAIAAAATGAGVEGADPE